MIQINLQPEYIFDVLGFSITNSFFTAVSVTFILSFLAFVFFVCKDKNENESIFLKAWHILIFELLQLADTITQDRKLSKRLIPLVATLFLFIVGTNLIALLPGFLGSFLIDTAEGSVSLFRSPNSDLTTTLALALVTVFSIQYFSIQTLGIGTYIKRFFNISGVLPFILGVFEALSEIMRVLSFSFRLFGNVFAGEVLLLVIAFLVPFIIPVPFMVLEVFVSLIQAYIFCILALTYIKLSTHTNIKL